jgi:hypothetical protein
MSEDREHAQAHIERAIGRAREGVSEHLDEIDRRLRTKIDVRRHAGNLAPQLMAGGVVVGFVIGFGFPSLMKRLIQIGVPVLLAMKIAKLQSDGEVVERA